MASPTTPVTRALDDLGLAYELFVHDEPIKSLQAAAAARGLKPEQIVRSLVFRLEHGSFVMVLAPGPEQLSWPRLRQHLQVSRLTMATPEQVKRVTGFVPGTVSPFGLHQPLRLLADRRILNLRRASFGAGIPNAGVVLDPRKALDKLPMEYGEFLSPTPPAGDR